MSISNDIKYIIFSFLFIDHFDTEHISGCWISTSGEPIDVDDVCGVFQNLNFQEDKIVEYFSGEEFDDEYMIEDD
jgi:hypothetical protein